MPHIRVRYVRARCKASGADWLVCDFMEGAPPSRCPRCGGPLEVRNVEHVTHQLKPPRPPWWVRFHDGIPVASATVYTVSRIAGRHPGEQPAAIALAMLMGYASAWCAFEAAKRGHAWAGPVILGAALVFAAALPFVGVPNQ